MSTPEQPPTGKYVDTKVEEQIFSSGEAENIHLLEHHTSYPHTRFSQTLDTFVRRIGDFVSWIWLALVLVIVLNVTLRYVFGEGRIELEEIQWHFYAIGFLIGMSYVIESDDHVRVDLLHTHFSLKTQGWVEFFGITLFLFPFMVLVLYYTVPFVANSFVAGERSQAPGGLPYRWTIRSALFFGFSLMIVAAVSRLSRVTSLLFGKPLALPVSNDQPGEQHGA